MKKTKLYLSETEWELVRDSLRTGMHKLSFETA